MDEPGRGTSPTETPEYEQKGHTLKAVRNHGSDEQLPLSAHNASALETYLGISVDDAFARVLRISRRLCENRQDIEDLVQEVFRRLSTKAREEASPIEDINAFLYTVAKNLHRDIKRRASREISFPVDNMNDPADRSPGPDELAIDRIETDVFTRLIAKLSRKEHREIVEAIAIQRLSWAEASRLLGRPRSTLRSQLEAAVKELRALRRRKGNENGGEGQR